MIVHDTTRYDVDWIGVTISDDRHAISQRTRLHRTTPNHRIAPNAIIRGSFNKFYLLLQNFASHMKFVTFVALSLSYTFMVNPIWYHNIYFYPYTVKAELRFWATETRKLYWKNVLILLVLLIHYDKWTDVFTLFKTKISHIFLNTTIICFLVKTCITHVTLVTFKMI